MSARLRVDLTVPLDRFTLKAAFETRAPVVGLFGASGAGKTTLLEAVAGLRRGASGRVELDGEVWLDSAKGIDRRPEARGVGYVPQDGLLFPHWDVEGNVLCGRARAGRRGGAGLAPDHVLEVLDLAALRGRRVGTLSGGERQRVALARALCSAPSLLLLDEPLASIEAPLRGRILAYLLAVRDEFRIPTIYVSHEATEVTVLCSEVVVLRAGGVAARGRPADVFTAEPDRAGVHGASYENVLEGAVAEADGTRLVVSLAGGRALVLAASPGAARGARALVGVRAGDLMIAVADTPGLSARNVLPGAVRGIREVEGGALVMVRVDESLPDLAVMLTEAARVALALAPGSAVRLVAKAHSIRLLAIR